MIVEPPFEQGIRVYEGVSVEGYLSRGFLKTDDRTVVKVSDSILGLVV